MKDDAAAYLVYLVPIQLIFSMENQFNLMLCLLQNQSNEDFIT